MPEIAIRHVVSASNSDTTHCAENLLKADTYRKWKAAQPGEKQVSVILQFEKEEQIYSIDIGNEGSAFVEVLAGSSASSSEQSYEVLLVTSSFMSPSESKGGTNLNRVRMFGPDKLVKATAERKWDRVKIVCTQPYTKSLAYGLSFVRFHSPPENNEVHSKTASPKVTKLGLFKVKEEDSNSSSLKPGALFFSRVHKPLVSPSKASQNDQPSPSYAAASLQTSMSGSPDPSPSSVEKPTSKGAPKEPAPVKRKFEFSKENTNISTTAKKSHPDTPRPMQPPSKKHKVSLSASPPQKMTVPKTSSSEVAANGSFQHLLDGTVFVLSGFQNPFRSELRHKALEMGGKYRPDWTPDSTHLICAFANTPKYSQVKGLGGIIVRKEWILDCYRTRRHLPCKRYLLARPESSSSEQEGESDEEASAQRHKPPAHPQRGNPPSSNHKPKTPASPKIARMPPRKASSEEEPSTSRNSGTQNNSQGLEADSAGSSSTDERAAGVRDEEEEGSGDTDDELRRVEEEHRKKKQGGQATVPPPEDDPYGGSTDENTDVEEKEEADQPIPELPDLFGGKHFFLYGEFPSQERRLLNRYITAFSGEVEAYMNERVNFVVTAQQWDDTFEEALNENANLSFVRPRWIYNCNERQKLIPHQPYVVVPQV
ncbi:DNA repair protein XRCC1 [Varanus komodoensis]|uniref:DNA repair protein XRCC1 n=1 Tax=Varanus komodoensis TaxID=61221 RepID=UPI001CF7A7FF|nr:DNA repair protein XRCC1 [Varanus komodoensis]KAF7242378.1 DNA repair protein XRCC1 [Varanus komodoensis]